MGGSAKHWATRAGAMFASVLWWRISSERRHAAQFEPSASGQVEHELLTSTALHPYAVIVAGNPVLGMEKLKEAAGFSSWREKNAAT